MKAGPPDLQLDNADLLNNLAADDVGLAPAYQTQPVNSSGGTERGGDIQFHPAPPEGRTSKAKGSGTQPASAAGSKLSKSSVFKEKKKLPKVNAWEQFEVNQFKVRNQEPGQIIARLQ